LHVAKKEGIGCLYTGCSTLILVCLWFYLTLTLRLTVLQGTTAKAAVRFVSYDTIKNSLADESGALSPGRGILAGVVAGGTESVLAVTPTERIKTALFVLSRPGLAPTNVSNLLILEGDGMKNRRRKTRQTVQVQHACWTGVSPNAWS